MPQAIAGAIVSAFGLTGLTATLIGGAIQLGLGLALSAVLQKKPKGPSFEGATPQDGQILTTSPVEPRRRIYGRGLYQGQLMFQRASGGYLHRIIAHGQGPIHQYVETRLNGKQVTVDGSGRVLSPPYDHGDAGSLVRVFQKTGTTTQAALLEPQEVAPEWSAAHQLKGTAYTYVRYQQRDSADQQASYPSGAPELQVLLDGANDIYDPRTETSGFTDNAALVIADWVEAEDGFGKVDSIYQPDLIAAANAADVSRSLASGGSTETWRLAGFASLAETPERALRQMLDACAGDIWLRPDGLIGMSVGGDAEPTVTLSEIQLLEVIELDDGADALDRYTELPATFVDEQMGHTETTMEAWVNSAEETRLGTTVVAAALDLRFAPYHAQARHAAKIKSLRDNPQKRATLKFRISALPAIYERMVALDIPSLGLSGDFRVLPFSLDVNDMTVTLQLAKVDPAAQGWTIAEEGAAQALPPQQEDADGPPAAPGDVQAIGHGDGASGAGIFVAYEDAVSDDVEHYVAYRTAGSGSWMGVTTSPGDTSVLIDGLTDAVEYDVAVIASETEIYDPDNADVTDVTIEAVAADIAIPVPAIPTDLAVVDGGNGVALVTVTASADASGRWTDILRGGVQVVRLRTIPGQVVNYADSSGAGTFTWTARAVSLSEELSSVTAGVTETIT